MVGERAFVNFRKFVNYVHVFAEVFEWIRVIDEPINIDIDIEYEYLNVAQDLLPKLETPYEISFSPLSSTRT